MGCVRWLVGGSLVLAFNLCLDRNSFAERPNLKTWLNRLAQSDIDVRFNISTNDNVMGITYLRDGEVCKDSDLGASWAVMNDRVSVTADDLALMKATNIKSQESQKFKTLPPCTEALEVDEFISIDADVVSDLDQEQDEYFEEEALSF